MFKEIKTKSSYKIKINKKQISSFQKERKFIKIPFKKINLKYKKKKIITLNFQIKTTQIKNLRLQDLPKKHPKEEHQRKK